MEGDGRPMPRRYRMDGDGQMRRTWNGKLPEEFDEKDSLVFAADTDLLLHGKVTEGTLAAIREAGYVYEDGKVVKPSLCAELKKAAERAATCRPEQKKGAAGRPADRGER